MDLSKPFYLAGPMSGIPQFNFPAFFAAAKELRAAGFNIISPAEIDNNEDAGAALASPDGNPTNRDHMNGKTWGDFLARDVKLIADHAQGIIFLPNWFRSRGAKLEAFTSLLCPDHRYGLFTGNNPLVAFVPRSFIANALIMEMNV